MAKCKDCLARELEEFKRKMQEQERCDGCNGPIQDWRNVPPYKYQEPASQPYWNTLRGNSCGGA